MAPGIEGLLDFRKSQLVYYSPYVFAKEVSLAEQYEEVLAPKISQYGTEGSKLSWEVSIQGENFVFLYEYLPWDSHYFSRTCYRLFTVLYRHENAPALIEAIQAFRKELLGEGNCYCTVEIPAEDIFLIQCLNVAGFKMVETRLHYYKTDLQNFAGERFAVRTASPEDIPVLSKVAATCRNSFDRLHADYAFSDQEADKYLATYAASAVNGYCDQVLVPDQKGLPVSSFIAINLTTAVFSKETLTFAKIGLAAVGEENRGWLVKLLSEAIRFARDNRADYIIYPTQATNKAAIRTCEKLNFQFGQAYHLLAFSSH
jgi:dTDP-4-amino-4,6-dideoxy-D-galactose acyltransferase